MSYQAIPFACCCGERPDRILEVGTTSEQTMVIHYWCSACNRVLFFSKDLAECVRECPAPDTADAPPRMAASDARFLQSVGIAVPD